MEKLAAQRQINRWARDSTRERNRNRRTSPAHRGGWKETGRRAFDGFGLGIANAARRREKTIGCRGAREGSPFRQDEDESGTRVATASGEKTSPRGRWCSWNSRHRSRRQPSLQFRRSQLGRETGSGGEYRDACFARWRLVHRENSHFLG